MQELKISEQKRITFTWALLQELDEVWELEQRCGTTWAHPKPFFEEALRYERLLIARDGTTSVAYLLYEVIWGNTAFLSLLKVLPDYQRKGIGKSMITVLEERLIKLGFKSYVTSSERVNPNTKRFFPDLGFTQIGELQMHHGEEIFYLKKFQ